MLSNLVATRTRLLQNVRHHDGADESAVRYPFGRNIEPDVVHHLRVTGDRVCASVLVDARRNSGPQSNASLTYLPFS